MAGSLPGPTSAAGAESGPLRTFRGLCDASGGVDAGDGCFWVAGDEDNVLRLYDPAAGDQPVRTLALDSFLAVQAKSPEADIEGAARMGDIVYWITSHGRNKDG
ncbi:MAG: DUF3616 domain-containing protein, partial [Verrucomicrobia bacterium]|nr:DUF3616 domain-containing protein [Verrucomicrobiota bacterium]